MRAPLWHQTRPALLQQAPCRPACQKHCRHLRCAWPAAYCSGGRTGQRSGVHAQEPHRLQGRKHGHLRECLLMAVLLLTFTHALDAQAVALADAASSQLPDSCAPLCAISDLRLRSIDTAKLHPASQSLSCGLQGSIPKCCCIVSMSRAKLPWTGLQARHVQTRSCQAACVSSR